MTRRCFDGLLLLAIGSVIFVLLGFKIKLAPSVDYDGLFYGARCLLQHADPYKESNIEHIYRADRRNGQVQNVGFERIATLYVNLPTAFVITAPFAVLPWGQAHTVWMVLTAALFIFASFLTWDLGAGFASTLSAAQICLLLAGSELLIEVGNAAGVAVSLAVAAVWCFLKERFVAVGMLCFAVSLMVKPHDACLVWFYFILAGGTYRRRALQTALIVIAISTPLITWVSHVSPDWPQELFTNLSRISAPGSPNDASPSTIASTRHGASITSLQSAIGIFQNDPHIYNPLSYLVCGPLLLIWVIVTLRARISKDKIWLALAAITALSMLPIYHRQHDTRLLLLTVPACAMLWAEGGIVGWLALLINSAGGILTGDLPLQLLAIWGYPIYSAALGLRGKILTVLFARPAPVILLTMACFYLWVYAHRVFSSEPSEEERGLEERLSGSNTAPAST